MIHHVETIQCPVDICQKAWVKYGKMGNIVNDSKVVTRCPKGMCVCCIQSILFNGQVHRKKTQRSCAAVYIMNEHKAVVL